MPILGINASAKKTVPDAPTIGTATVTNSTTVSLTFTAPTYTGRLPITSYTVTSSPSISLSTSGTTSPLTVTGTFAINQAYTFTIVATNSVGNSAASAASNSVTPLAGPTVTGGTLTSDATYYYRQFTANGTLGISGGNLTCDVLLVSGGGGGGYGTLSTSVTGGGGGAGGLLLNSSQSLTGNYTVTIGAGAVANGGYGTYSAATASSVTGFTSPTVGGRGGGATVSSSSSTFTDATSGGSGGGAPSVDSNPRTGGGGTSGQGNNGGNVTTSGYGGAGGGGQSSVGGNGQVNIGRRAGGSGGTGWTSWTGFSLAGGGGGGGQVALYANITDPSAESRGFGSNGGGTGAGATSTWDSINGLQGTYYSASGGAPNTGGGGGGGGYTTSSLDNAMLVPGNGGSGTVIVRYTRSQVGG